MADIFHDFPINAPIDRVFAAVSTPRGLDRWWTKSSGGTAELGAEFELGFGPGYDWRAQVTRCVVAREFELEMTRADKDWIGTRVGFALESRPASLPPSTPASTIVRFHHTGWPQANEHWRTSTFCWAMYLRVLRRDLEHGEFVPYERRLDA